MEANGKNLRMFTYQTHDYMDEHPEISFRTEESQETADKYIEHMRNHWFSGTISDAKEVTPEEFYNARQSNYWKGYEEQLDNLASDCTQEWLDEYNKLLNNESN